MEKLHVSTTEKFNLFVMNISPLTLCPELSVRSPGSRDQPDVRVPGQSHRREEDKHYEHGHH